MGNVEGLAIGVASSTGKPFCGKGSPVELEPLNGCSVFVSSKMMTKTEHRTTEPAVVNVKAGNALERTRTLLDRIDNLHKRMTALYPHGDLGWFNPLSFRISNAHVRLIRLHVRLRDEAAGCLPTDVRRSLNVLNPITSFVNLVRNWQDHNFDVWWHTVDRGPGVVIEPRDIHP